MPSYDVPSHPPPAPKGHRIGRLVLLPPRSDTVARPNGSRNSSLLLLCSHTLQQVLFQLRKEKGGQRAGSPGSQQSRNGGLGKGAKKCNSHQHCSSLTHYPKGLFLEKSWTLTDPSSSHIFCTISETARQERKVCLNTARKVAEQWQGQALHYHFSMRWGCSRSH